MTMGQPMMIPNSFVGTARLSENVETHVDQVNLDGHEANSIAILTVTM